MSGPVPDDRLAELSASYDAAVRDADPSDVRVGSTTTRVSDFVNRGPEFDGLYLYPPLLDAAGIVIDGPFKLSTMHARAVRPGVAAQTLHVDFARDAAGWPMVGFILMVDDFRADNGFVPRVGFVRASVSNRYTLYGKPGALFERFNIFGTTQAL